jgi:hypothetical protein
MIVMFSYSIVKLIALEVLWIPGLGSSLNQYWKFHTSPGENWTASGDGAWGCFEQGVGR